MKVEAARACGQRPTIHSLARPQRIAAAPAFMPRARRNRYDTVEERPPGRD